MSCMKIFYLFNLCFFLPSIYGHGFSSNTYVRAGKSLWSIQQVCYQATQSKIFIPSYDFNISKRVSSRVCSAAQSEVNCYFKLGFDLGQSDILCSPTQEFYVADSNAWTPAYLLNLGDVLLSDSNQLKSIISIELIKQPLKVYCLEIDKTHTFMVGRHSIITHNMALPVLSLGLSIAFGSAAAGGTIGSCFGPVAIAGGIALGGIVGIITRLGSQCDNLPQYKIDFNMCEIERRAEKTGILCKENSDDAQAPGKPNEEDGFIPPKNWDGKKAKHSKTGQHGWPDKKGNVWVPSGPGPKAHGGAHWDVVAPNGKDYDNVYPGGTIRKGRK